MISAACGYYPCKPSPQIGMCYDYKIHIRFQRFCTNIEKITINNFILSKYLEGILDILS